ncbi:hypothetical protein [Argonema galeatum]|uniref:hypothetical protein n=1 Tax=Argonema galeatum TaxID=2942762 RepID=UPI002011810C|nr:hypothetical protein [Argonema galeatum]MCL1466264.1 hypothetical protein [Argonema galeatum A003/A1]
MPIYSNIKTKITIPSEIQALIDRLNQELAQIEREATEGLNLARPILSRFPDNVILIGSFATLNNALFFVDNSRRRIQITVESISPENVPASVIQEAGEDLAELQGRIMEAKIRVSRIVNRLENLP